MQGKTALLRFFSPHALEIEQSNFTRKDTAADGTQRTLSRSVDKGARISLLLPRF